MKSIVDGFTSFLNVIDKLTEKIGLLGTIGLGAGLFAGIKNKGIFKTTTNESGKLTLGTNLGNIKDFFKRQNILSDSDINAIKAYNEEFIRLSDKVKASTTHVSNYTIAQKAANNTMQNASQKAKDMVAQANGSTVALNNMTRASKAAELGLKTLRVAANMALSMGIMWGISEVISLLYEFSQASKKAAENAQELGAAFKSTKSDIEDYKSQIEELYATITDSSSSISDITEARKSLMSIQDEMIEKYGAEKDVMEAITSVMNGQTDAVDNLSDALDNLIQKQWQETKNELNKGGDTVKERFVNSVTNAIHGYKDNIERMESEYGDYTAKINLSRTGMDASELEKLMETLRTVYGTKITSFYDGSLMAEFNGDAAEVYNTLYEIQNLSSRFNFSDSLEKQLTIAVNTAKEISDKYSDYWEGHVFSDKIFADEDYNKIFNNLLGAYDEYSDAKLSGDEAKIKEYSDAYAKLLSESLQNVEDENVSGFFMDMYPELKETFADYDFKIKFTPDIKDDGFDERVNAALDKLNGKTKEEILGLNMSVATDGQIQGYDELKAITREYGMDLEWLLSLLEEMGEVQSESYKQLIDTFGEENIKKIAPEDLEIAYTIDNAGDMTFEEFQAEIERQKENLDALTFSFDFEAETTGMENLFSSIKESVSSAGLAAEAIENLKERYSDLSGYDAGKLFERTSNGIHLNTSALRELESQYEKEKKQGIDKHLDALSEQYNELTEKINSTSDAAERSALHSERQGILEQINSVADLAAQYEGLTSAFYKWEQAQSMGEEGDTYDSLANGLEEIKKLYDEGLVGTNKFRAAVQLMSSEDLSTANVDELISAYESGYGKIKRYFTEGQEGCQNFLEDVHSLNSEWAKMNEDGSWEINFGQGNDQQVADALGINVESVQAVLKKLSDFGFDINLDSAYSSFSLLESEAEKANTKLLELGKTDVVFDFNADGDALDREIKKAQKLLNGFKDSDGTVNIQTEGAQEAESILITLLSQKQVLNQPAILRVDTSQVASEISNVVGLLQEYTKNSNDLEIQAAIGADTSDAQSKIQDVLNKVNAIPDDAKVSLGLDDVEFQNALASITGTEVDVKAGVNLDDTALQTIQQKINAITPEMMVEAGIDASAIEEYEPEDKDAEVVYSVDDDRVKEFINEDHDATGIVHYDVDAFKVKSFIASIKNIDGGTIRYTVQASDNTGEEKSGGDAKASGTAYAEGRWGTKNDGTALVGELGTELLVRDGKYMTVGDDSVNLSITKKGTLFSMPPRQRKSLKKGKSHRAGNAEGRSRKALLFQVVRACSGTGLPARHPLLLPKAAVPAPAIHHPHRMMKRNRPPLKSSRTGSAGYSTGLK